VGRVSVFLKPHAGQVISEVIDLSGFLQHSFLAESDFCPTSLEEIVFPEVDLSWHEKRKLTRMIKGQQTFFIM
jgi:hypothetical protein